LLELGVSRKEWHDETETLAHEALHHRPGFEPAILALGALAGGRGDHAAAAERFEALAAAHQAKSELLFARLALMASARHQAKADAPRATRLLERALILAPDDPAAQELLETRYEAEGRADELLRMLSRRVSEEPDPSEQAHLRLRLGRIHLAGKRDPLRACE